MKKIKLQYLIFLLILICSLILLKHARKVPAKKQIILISIDTLRWDHLSSAGYFRDTSPNISSLISDSVYYRNAYTNGCWTIPAHMSMLTGVLPSSHGLLVTQQSMRDKTVPNLSSSITLISEIIESYDSDINTVSFARLPRRYGFSKGFDTIIYKDLFANINVFDELLKEFENNKNNDFFFFIHTWMVHTPYTNSYYLKDRLDDTIRNRLDNFRENKSLNVALMVEFRRLLKENDLYNKNDCVALYDGGIRYVDAYIGKLIAFLKQNGLYDDMMIIITSDHGESFEEHFPIHFFGIHGLDFYEEFVHIPLIIKFPNQKVKKSIMANVSHIDIIPTKLDCYNIPGPTYLQGESLLKPFFMRKNKFVISEGTLLNGTETKMIKQRDYKYLITAIAEGLPKSMEWDSIKERRLFYLKDDPSEQNNLYGQPEYNKIAARLESTLKEYILKAENLNVRSTDNPMEEETIKQLKSLGYIE